VENSPPVDAWTQEMMAGRPAVVLFRWRRGV